MTSPATSTFQSSLRLIQARWAALAPSERLSLVAVAWVLGISLLWWLAISPALQTLRVAQTQHAALDQQRQTMQGLQTQAQALLAAPKLTTSDALKALESATKQSLGTTAQVNAVGERVTITFKAVAADAMAQWLAQARVNAHALPTEAKLMRSVTTATTATPPAPAWDGSIVMRLP